MKFLSIYYTGVQACTCHLVHQFSAELRESKAFGLKVNSSLNQHFVHIKSSYAESVHCNGHPHKRSHFWSCSPNKCMSQSLQNTLPRKLLYSISIQQHPCHEQTFYIWSGCLYYKNQTFLNHFMKL